MSCVVEIIGQGVLFAPEIAAEAAAVATVEAPLSAAPAPEQLAVSLRVDEYTDPLAFDAAVDHIVDTRSVDYGTARAIAAAGLTAPLRPAWMLSPATARNNADRAQQTREMLAAKGMPATNHRHTPVMTRHRLHR